MSKVFIYTIPRKSVQGLDDIKDPRSDKKLTKTKHGLHTGYTYGILYDTKLGKRNTGLFDLVDNPHYVDRKEAEEKEYKRKISELEDRLEKGDNAKDKKALNDLYDKYREFKSERNRAIDSAKSKLSTQWEYLSDKQQITRQEFLEFKHGRSPGYYTAEAPLKKLKGEPATYMELYKKRLNDGLTVLDLAIPEDEVFYWACMGYHKYIAPSKKSWLSHARPYATHYLSLQEEDEELAMASKRLRNRAIAMLEDESFNKTLKEAVVKDLNWQRGEISEAQAYSLLSGKIENADYKSKVNDATKFIEAYEKTKTAEGREYLMSSVLLSDLIYNRVITNVKDTYTWNTKSLVIGHNKKDAINFLMDPNKADQVKMVKGELKAKYVV
jgi:hypothetical protein